MYLIPRRLHLHSYGIGASLTTLDLFSLASFNWTSLCPCQSEHMARLVKVPGIIISASGVRAKATRITLQCRSCRAFRPNIPVRPGLEGYSLPRKCETYVQCLVVCWVPIVALLCKGPCLRRPEGGFRLRLISPSVLDLVRVGRSVWAGTCLTSAVCLVHAGSKRAGQSAPSIRSL